MLDYGKRTSFARSETVVFNRKARREREREKERDVKERARSLMIEIKIIFSAGGLYAGRGRFFSLR